MNQIATNNTSVSLADLIASYNAHLLTSGVVNQVSQLIWIARREPAEHQMPHNDIVFRIGKATLMDDFSGGGRQAARVKRTISVMPRVQYATDKGNSDLQWIIAQDNFEVMVVDALLGYVPIDVNDPTRELCTFPPRVVQSNDPMKEQKNTVWGDSILTLELSYNQKINRLVI